ncbi:zinc finger protein 2 [Drosophila novamexicana]|uniref:zinc finger protein 2 n=1 Tax=Drosophila novamexicana TaxID=47314 RepID=UPI0011E5F47E|nr:zinc finger protein 2 [Drosophila novamexicana]
MKTELNEKWIVCRVCLNNPNEGEDILQDIFSQNASTRLDQMLHICAGIPVSVDDNFPDKMCSKCVRVLRVAYKFRLTCQRSHQHIADMLSTDMDTHLGAGDDEEAEAEAIARAWEEQTNPINAQIKLEHDVEDTASEFINYVVSGDDTDAIVYDATNTEDEQNAVVYDGATVVEVAEAEIETETDTENFAEYEELEVLAAESMPPSSSTEQTTRSTRRIVWTEVPDDDVTQDILSSDDDSYLPEAKAQPRLLNRVRQPRKVQQRPKMTTSSINGEHEEKKMGRKPRDKHSNYICDVCGNIYPSQARLTEHMKFHSGVKPHECEICGRGFVQNQQLVRHMNTHTGNRPYKCNFCPAAFADRSTKTKHHRIHTKERPYECDVCLKTFTYSDNLKFHKMIHTGEKPHVCDLCGKGFVKAYKMRLHRVTHEKRGPWKPVDLDMETTERIKDDMSDMVIGILPSA